VDVVAAVVARVERVTRRRRGDAVSVVAAWVEDAVTAWEEDALAEDGEEDEAPISSKAW